MSGLGAKIRALRRRDGVTQVQLAQRLEISPAYLNLIEHDKRPLPAPLLIRLAQVLQVDLASFASDADQGLEAHVREVFSDPMFDESGLVGADMRELVVSSPAVARAVVQLYDAWRQARTAADLLAVRVSEDDTLGIDRSRLSSEEVSDFIQRRMNWFPELEDAAEALWAEAKLDAADIAGGLQRWLRGRLNVTVRTVPVGEDGGMTRLYDPLRRELRLSEALPPRARLFQLAHQVALIQHGDLLDRLTRDDRMTNDTSRALGRVALANYFAAAVVMPYDRFHAAARQVRWDAELLGYRFGASFEQICHRMTSLRRPGSEGIPFHFLKVDVAGNISKRFSASGIQYPRFAGVCARWNVFAAFTTPGTVRAQVSRMPDGTGYFCFTRTVRREGRGYRARQALSAIGLGCPLSYARELVYSDGVDVDNALAAVPIGVTCRTCTRMDCEQRACPPLQQPLEIDPNARGAHFFAPHHPLPGGG